MRAILDIILLILDIYRYVVLAFVIFSLLVSFNVISMQNDILRKIGNFLWAATEPALRPIRKMIPNIGNIDISPIILFLAIMFVEIVIARYIYPYVF
jgi:YGGT family.